MKKPGDLVRLYVGPNPEEIQPFSYAIFDDSRRAFGEQYLPGKPIGKMYSGDMGVVLEVEMDHKKPMVKVLVNGQAGWLAHYVDLEVVG